MPSEKRLLAHNTFMLYLLTGSNYFFGLVTIPYLTRVLGADVYGRIGFALAFCSIVQMVLDFGFQLSGIIDVAANRDDHAELSRIVSAVTLAKLMLAAPTFAVVLAMCAAVPRFSSDAPLLFLFFFYAVFNTLSPDFFYRGMEDMKTVTVRSVTVKAIFTVCIVVFVHGAEQYILVPVFYSLGALAGLSVVLQHMKSNMGVWFTRVGIADAMGQLRRGSLFFISRIATSVYTNFNVLVLGVLFPSGPIVGQYTACNQLITAGRQAINPVTGSLFPHIVRTKDFRLLGRVMLLGEGLLVPVCIAACVFSEPLCTLLFGAEFRSAAGALRLLLVLLPIAYASYLCGWSGLGALGLDRIANLSNIVGAVVQMLLLAVFILSGFASLETVCVATVVTEFIVLAIRAIALIRGIDAFNRNDSQSCD